MILGLDISSAKIGIAILDYDKNILYSNTIKFDKKFTLFQRVDFFKKLLLSIKNDYTIDKVVIEEPLMMFGANSMAQIICLLQRINGMISYLVYEIFEIEPIMANVIMARKKIGIKIERTKEKKTTKEKKQPIIDFVVDLYKDTETPIEVQLNRNGVWKDEMSDMIDAIVVCLSILQKKG